MGTATIHNVLSLSLSLDPSWGVVNRGIMVCIECSGVHRAMGVHISKVRSVELDTEIWTDTLINVRNNNNNNNNNNNMYKYILLH